MTRIFYLLTFTLVLFIVNSFCIHDVKTVADIHAVQQTDTYKFCPVSNNGLLVEDFIEDTFEDDSTDSQREKDAPNFGFNDFLNNSILNFSFYNSKKAISVKYFFPKQTAIFILLKSMRL
jgi:hypothetical protein